jgi:hypothetical protein
VGWFYRLVQGYFHCGVKYFPLRQYNNSCFIGCNPVFHPLQVSSRLTAPFFDQNSLCIASQQEKQGSPQVYQMNVLCQRSSLIFPNMTGKYVCSDTNEHGRCPVFSFSLLPIGSQTITKPTSSLIVQMIWTIKPPHFRSLYPLLPGDFNALVVSNVSMRQWMSHLALEPNKVNHQQWTMSGDHRLRPYGLPS